MPDSRPNKLITRQTVPIDLDLLEEARKRFKRLGFRSFGAYCNFLVRNDLSGSRSQLEGTSQPVTDEEAHYVAALLRFLRSSVDETLKEKALGILRLTLELQSPGSARRKQTTQSRAMR